MILTLADRERSCCVPSDVDYIKESIGELSQIDKGE